MGTQIIVSGGNAGFERGEPIECNGVQLRITSITGSTLTVRTVFRWRVVEWLASRVENVIWWLADRRATKSDTLTVNTPDLGRNP